MAFTVELIFIEMVKNIDRSDSLHKSSVREFIGPIRELNGDV